MRLKAFKYRLYPSKSVAAKMQHVLDLSRELYNGAIQERRDAYRMAGVSISFYDQSKQLPAIKDVRPDLNDVFSQTLQDVLHRVDKAFKAFFARMKRREKVGYPRFQGRNRYDSFTFPQAGWQLHNDRVTLSKIGNVKIKLHRPVRGKVKTVTIKRDGAHWYVTFSVEQEQEAKGHTGGTIGLDMGLEYFSSDSDGNHVENPRFFRKSEKRVAKAQRRLAKVTKTAPDRAKFRVRVTAAYRTIRNQRADFLHKQSARLVRLFGLIVVEDLNIKGLASGMLAKSVNDAAWRAFIEMLRYKAANAGSRLIEVDARGTSQICPSCGVVRKKELSERWHTCDCGLSIQRDHAAALVILARGLSSIGSQSVEALPL